MTVNSFTTGDPFFTDLETVEEDLTLYGTAVVEYIERQGTLTPPQEDHIRRVTRTLESPTITSTTGPLASSTTCPTLSTRCRPPRSPC